MATTNEILQRMTRMQPDAQAALPVTPNNGNPAGANNMPGVVPPPISGPAPAQTQHPQQQRSPYYYPWLGPSPAMNHIHQLLGQPLQQTQPQPDPRQQINSFPVVPRRA